MHTNQTRPRRSQANQRPVPTEMLGLLLVLVLALAGCGTNEGERPVDLKSPEQLLQGMLGISQTIIDLHGGQWKYENGQPWDPERTKGYRGTSCATDPESLQYTMSVLGSAVNDPKAAVANVKEYFTQRGFAVTNRFKSEFKGDWYIVFSMINDDGASFVYKPGTHGSQIIVESGCSTDPVMNQVTE